MNVCGKEACIGGAQSLGCKGHLGTSIISILAIGLRYPVVHIESYIYNRIDSLKCDLYTEVLIKISFCS